MRADDRLLCSAGVAGARQTNCPELAARLEVSERTAHRDSLLLRLAFDDEDQAAFMVLSFSPRIDVRSPASIRDRIDNDLAAALNRRRPRSELLCPGECTATGRT